MLLLVLLNLYIAKTRKENPTRLALEHFLLAAAVIITSYFVGNLTSVTFGQEWIRQIEICV